MENLRHSIIDARTDDRWVRSVESHVAREEWEELWTLAQKAPPIWTVRILKYLKKQAWMPEPEHQSTFFDKLSFYSSACNEFDLPGPGMCQPSVSRLDTAFGRIATARVTADGEFVFVLEDKRAAIEVRRVADLAVIDRIRLDMVSGKQYAVLALDITRMGDQLAVLTYESTSSTLSVHIYELDMGEVQSDRWFKCTNTDIGFHAPSICFDGEGNNLFVQTGSDLVTVWDIKKGVNKGQIELNSDFDNLPLAYAVSADSPSGEWCKFGRRVVAEPSSRRLVTSSDGTKIATTRGLFILGWQNPRALGSIMRSSTGLVAMSADGYFIATVNAGGVQLMNLRDEEQTELADCFDPLTQLAFSNDSELLAVAMSHSDNIKLWHLPDGRNLGTLRDLAHDVLVEFKFTSGGSIVAVTRSGVIQVWEADGNGNAWPWSPELVQITHQPVDSSSVQVLRQAQEMRKRGWLSVQESNLLDLALALMQNRLNLDIEIEWDAQLPGDIYDIEIE